MKVTLVLLRGLMRDKRHWRSFILALEKHKHFNVFCIDLPGTGELSHIKSPSNIESCAKYLNKNIPHFGMPVYIIGLSMGGMVASEFMKIQNKNRIFGIFIINSSNGAFNKFYQRLNFKSLLLIPFFLILSAKYQEKLIAYLTSNNSKIVQNEIQYWFIYRKQRKITTLNFLRQLYASSHYKQYLKPSENIVFIGSKKDRLVNFNCTEKWAKAWQSKYYIHETAGHDIPLDDPIWLIKILQSEYIRLNKD
ncbi:hypothetical protein CF386_10540 [Paraphotobacterium marinum]|uniref:AB hydrolase-1 domain-containing protein n=1 Tax=Paraphotobacterium marinum TaxID=1755811 RepID=A0A220VGN4_9GAMM|nr:alpha/beta hydrolase [Paraphotobacterium marinum]ASK79489.1 hypothetical protein CF386_10540 [Paraphotobacterium marinum]